MISVPLPSPVSLNILVVKPSSLLFDPFMSPILFAMSLVHSALEVGSQWVKTQMTQICIGVEADTPFPAL